MNGLHGTGLARIRLSRSDWAILGASLLLQLALGLFFGHAYDTRINMATGYLVAAGQNPYLAQNLTGVFHNTSFSGITSIGYPPPWPLLLGLVYSLSYRFLPNFLLYNLAIKLPIIAANVALAFLVRSTIVRLGGKAKAARFAWLFILFNPFFLYASSAWGQFDSIVTLLTLLSLLLLAGEKWLPSAILLALATSFKPTAMPVMVAAFLFLRARPALNLWRYFGVFIAALLLFAVAPFPILGWSPAVILQHWNFHFTVGGGLSFLSFLELVQGSTHLPGAWWLIGLLWVPAVAAAAIALRNHAVGLIGLFKTSSILIMVFFLSSAWVSEPNILLVLPLILILVAVVDLDRRILTALWLIPLVFSIFNTAAFQLLFPSMPGLMTRLMNAIFPLEPGWWILRSLVAFLWLLAGIRTVAILSLPGMAAAWKEAGSPHAN